MLGSRDNPYPYMRQCDIYVQPSAFEGLSLTLTEALTIGKACVTTNFDGVPDLLVNGRDALIVPCLAGPMADAIESLIKDEALRRDLADMSRNMRFHFEDKSPVLYDIMEGKLWKEIEL